MQKKRRIPGTSSIPNTSNAQRKGDKADSKKSEESQICNMFQTFALSLSSQPFQKPARPIVCLISTRDRQSGFVTGLKKKNVFELKEAAIPECVSVIVPAKKIAFVIDGAGAIADIKGASLENEISNYVSRKQKFEHSRSRAAKASTEFAKTVVLIVRDLELYKLLSVELPSKVSVYPCRTMEDAISQFERFLLAPEQV